MPIYEFHCKRCRRDFEQRMSVAKMKQSASCPRCGTRSARKLSAFTLVRGAAPDLMSDDLTPGDIGAGGDDLDLDDDF